MKIAEKSRKSPLKGTLQHKLHVRTSSTLSSVPKVNKNGVFLQKVSEKKLENFATIPFSWSHHLVLICGACISTIRAEFFWIRNPKVKKSTYRMDICHIKASSVPCICNGRIDRFDIRLGLSRTTYFYRTTPHAGRIHLILIYEIWKFLTFSYSFNG